MTSEPTTDRAGPSRIVVADDHPIFREAIRYLFSEFSANDLEVVGEAKDGQEALEMCRRLRPDLVLMDVGMPGMDGLEATRAIKGEFPSIAVLVLSAAEEPGHLAKALKAGASGYVVKNLSSRRLIDAIREVLGGEYELDPGLAARLLRQMLDEAPEQEERSTNLPTPPERDVDEGHMGSSSTLEALTEREREVLRLLACGQTNAQIARSLLLSVSTVKKYVQRVMAKLGVSDRVQAAVRAVELGLLSEGEG